jgi:group I intron endonuclease
MFIYLIRNNITSQVYIGKFQGAKIKTRWKRHLWNARNGSDYYIHRAIAKYGEENFTCEVIATTDQVELLAELETFCIRHFNSHVTGYNLTLGGEGVTPNEATREKQRQKRLEWYKDPTHYAQSCATLAQVNAARIGTKASKSHCDNISKALKGRVPSELCMLRSSEARALDTLNGNPRRKGWHRSPEANEKNRQARLGKPAWNKGKSSKSPMDGKKHSESSKQKMREARLLHYSRLTND